MRLLLPFFLVVVVAVSGCAARDLIATAETPRQKWHAINIVFDEYDAAGLAIKDNPATPENVKRVLRESRAAAVAALDVAELAFAAYQDAADQLDAVPNQTNLDVLTAALTAVTSRLDEAESRIRSFVTRVKEAT